MSDHPVTTDPLLSESAPQLVPNSVHIAPVVHDSIGAIALALGCVMLLVAHLRLLERYRALLERQQNDTGG